MNYLLILFGKALSKASQFFNLGHGSTWPGHIALLFNEHFIKDLLKNSKAKIILIAGTNGKTTTGKLIKTILEEGGKKVLQNESGANLLNGVASSLIKGSSIFGKLNYNFLIFESDENALPLILKTLRPGFVIALNLFRDQLDRYGEIDSIAYKWKRSFEKLSKNTAFILNADDPLITYLGKKLKKVYYFGLKFRRSLKSLKPAHGADSIYCPSCNSALFFSSISFSHLGNWKCPNCGLQRPKPLVEQYSFYPLAGAYNKYNVLAALALSKILGVKEPVIENGFRKFSPAFGRQEKLNIDGKKVQLFLSKNPTSFNQSLSTIKSLGAKNIVIVLNDRIPDGRDVSWIWDIDLEEYLKNIKNITISGDRCYDMGLRAKYSYSSKFQISNFKFQIEPNLDRAIEYSLSKISKNETLYILPTYSAMLEVRKILTGRKIL